MQRNESCSVEATDENEKDGIDSITQDAEKYWEHQVEIQEGVDFSAQFYNDILARSPNIENIGQNEGSSLLVRTTDDSFVDFFDYENRESIDSDEEVRIWVQAFLSYVLTFSSECIDERVE